MLHFSRLKILFIFIVIFLSFALCIPSTLPKPWLDKLPSWLADQTIRLGLDLQGGSYLLLEVQVDSYVKEQLTLLEDDIRKAYRKAGIGYRDLATPSSSELRVTIRDANKIQQALTLIHAFPSKLLTKEQNGTITLSYHPDELKQMQENLLSQSLEIVRRRIDESGLREPTLQRQGKDRILLQVPGLENPDELKALLGETAKLSFHFLSDPTPLRSGIRPAISFDSMLLPSDQPNPNTGEMEQYIVKKRVMLSGDLLVSAQPGYNQYSQSIVNFRFNTKGARKFAEITKANVGKPFAIVLDNKVISAPVIQEPILQGSGQISGNFTTESANQLAILLRAGALPAPLKILEERSIGPSLGADSVAAGKLSALIGGILVTLFMMITYRLFGFFASVAMIVHLFITIAALVLLQATLTLPGIAGLVLTMGMTVDANVLIFERMKEERRVGRTPYAAIEHGFKQAFMTIVDSNITTLIVAVLLYIFGTGSIRGFGVTLSIGIVSSIFTSILLVRLMIVTWLKRTKPKALPIG